MRYNFVPLVPGNVALPSLYLDMLRHPGAMQEVITKMLPTHVFVQVPSAVIQLTVFSCLPYSHNSFCFFRFLLHLLSRFFHQLHSMVTQLTSFFRCFPYLHCSLAFFSCLPCLYKSVFLPFPSTFTQVSVFVHIPTIFYL